LDVYLSNVWLKSKFGINFVFQQIINGIMIVIVSGHIFLQNVEVSSEYSSTREYLFRVLEYWIPEILTSLIYIDYILLRQLKGGSIMVSTLNEYLIFTNGQLYIMTRIIHCVNKMSRDIYVMVFYTVSEEMPNFDSLFLFIYFVFRNLSERKTV
jgi:hypothetical protein